MPSSDEVRYSVMTARLHTDSLWGRWPEYEQHENGRPTRNLAVRIADHIGGGSYIVTVRDHGDRIAPELLTRWDAPTRADASRESVKWWNDTQLAERACMYLRARWDWIESLPDDYPRWFEFAQAFTPGDTLANVAAHARIAASLPIPEPMTTYVADHLHLSERTAARRITAARKAGHSVPGTGRPGRPTRRSDEYKKEN